MQKQYFLFLLALLCTLGIIAPHLLHAETSNPLSSDNYGKGFNAMKQGQYDKAEQYLRKVHPKERKYPKALKLIEEVTIARAKALLKKKKYVEALREVYTVLPESRYYEEAQKLQHKIEFHIAQNNHRYAPEGDRLKYLKQMVRLSVLTLTPEFATQSIKAIGRDLSRLKTREDVESLIALTQKLTKHVKTPEIAETALAHLFSNFESWENQPNLRRELLSLMAKLKLSYLSASSE